MQNKLILVLLTVIACCFVACDQTTECKYHRDTYDISTAKPNNNWVFDKASREFVSHVNMSVITPFIYNYGNWSLCREFNKGYNDAYQVQLPMSNFKSDTLEENSVVYYTQYIDYRVGTEYVEIQVTNSDYLYGPEKPETMAFRLQVDSQVVVLVANQDNWIFDEPTQQYYTRFDAPEIPVEVFEGGQWSINRLYNMGTADAFQVPLPMSCFMTDTLINTQVIYYTEHLDYRVGVGYVELRLRNSDHLYFTDPSGNIRLPENMDFRLQLIY